jgi:hypothetical protein
MAVFSILASGHPIPHSGGGRGGEGGPFKQHSRHVRPRHSQALFTIIKAV